jgi:hypothetical protein
MTFGIILPPGVNEKRPVWRCNVCELEFKPEQKMAFRIHVIDCAKRHEGELEEMVADVTTGNEFVGMNDDVREEFKWKRQEAIAEGERGKGLND